MTDIALTAAQVEPCFPEKAEIFTFVASATITKGQAVYVTSAGLCGVADANGSGTVQFRGIALEGGGAGQAIPVLKRGHVYGFTVSSLDSDTILYLSNTAGALADAAGSTTVNVGRVTTLADSSATDVVWIEADWLNDWS